MLAASEAPSSHLTRPSDSTHFRASQASISLHSAGRTAGQGLGRDSEGARKVPRGSRPARTAPRNAEGTRKSRAGPTRKSRAGAVGPTMTSRGALGVSGRRDGLSACRAGRRRERPALTGRRRPALTGPHPPRCRSPVRCKPPPAGQNTQFIIAVQLHMPLRSGRFQQAGRDSAGGRHWFRPRFGFRPRSNTSHSRFVRGGRAGAIILSQSESWRARPRGISGSVRLEVSNRPD